MVVVVALVMAVVIVLVVLVALVVDGGRSGSTCASCRLHTGR